MEKLNLGDVANSLIVGTDFVTRLLHIASIATGAFLFIMAFSLLRSHRTNPKFIPLDRPIIYMCLGVILIALPFYGKLFTLTGSTIDLKKKEEYAIGVQPQDIDAPLDWGNDYDH